jgi:AcrR family transcriptional regulator
MANRKAVDPRKNGDSSREALDGERPLRRDAARNRERLLETAAEVFADQGLEAGVVDIARLAGVGMGTLYRRFPSKEALIEELVSELLSDLLCDAREAVGEGDGRGLETFLYALGARQSSPLGFLPRLWTTPEHAKLMSAIQEVAAELLADAQRQGQVRADLTPSDVFTIMWSLRGVIEATRGIAPNAWRRHLDIILAGLAPATEPLPHEPLAPDVMNDVIAKVTSQKRPS